MTSHTQNPAIQGQPAHDRNTTHNAKAASVDAGVKLSIQQISELQTIQRCQSAIVDMMNACTHFDEDTRDSSTHLLGYFSDKLLAITENLVADALSQLSAKGAAQ